MIAACAIDVAGHHYHFAPPRRFERTSSLIAFPLRQASNSTVAGLLDDSVAATRHPQRDGVVQRIKDLAPLGVYNGDDRSNRNESSGIASPNTTVDISRSADQPSLS